MEMLGTETTELKRIMYSKNITQSKLSRMSGIAYPQINTYCNGVNKPGIKIQNLTSSDADRKK